MKITYDQLNEVVHSAADAFEEVGLDMSSYDRTQLNDYLSRYLDDRGIETVEEV